MGIDGSRSRDIPPRNDQRRAEGRQFAPRTGNFAPCTGNFPLPSDATRSRGRHFAPPRRKVEACGGKLPPAGAWAGLGGATGAAAAPMLRCEATGTPSGAGAVAPVGKRWRGHLSSMLPWRRIDLVRSRSISEREPVRAARLPPAMIKVWIWTRRRSTGATTRAGCLIEGMRGTGGWPRGCEYRS